MNHKFFKKIKYEIFCFVQINFGPKRFVMNACTLCANVVCSILISIYNIYHVRLAKKERQIRSKKKQKSGIFLAKMGQIELPHIFDVHIIFVFGANHKFLICSTASCIGCCPDHRKVELWAHALFQHSVHEVCLIIFISFLVWLFIFT